jgi:ABC-type cobalamin transport system ATPase subunit
MNNISTNAPVSRARLVLWVASVIGLPLSGSAWAQRVTTPTKVRQVVAQLGGASTFLREMSKAASESLPQRVDSEWELISSVAIGNTITMTHRAINLSRKGADQAKLRDQGYKNAVARNCTEPIAGTLILEYGVSYRYTTLSREGEFITRFLIDANSCRSAGLSPSE